MLIALQFLKKDFLVELGTHEELLAKDGVYSELYYTYYSHQGVEELTEVRQAPEKVEMGTSPMDTLHASPMMHPHGNMSKEEREKMMERFKKMSPEERENMRQRFHP